MKRIYCLLFIIYCLLPVCQAQTMVLGVDRAQDSVPDKRGPNMKTFGCAFLGGGLVASGDQPGARIIYGASGEIFTGYRAKYKISPVYSLGWEAQINLQYYKLKQEDGKILPDTTQHKVERFDNSSIGLSFYNRFNFDPNRGNYLGKFLDIGISGNWIFDFTHLTKDKGTNNTDIKVAQTNLPYVNNFASYVFARVGSNTISIYARYRFSDFFKPINVIPELPPSYPELPRLMVGVEFAIFRD